MQEAENDSVNIRLYENGIAAEVDFYHNGVVTHKAISLEDLTQCFLRSQESNQILFNGLLPTGLISHYDSPTEKYYVCLLYTSVI